MSDVRAQARLIRKSLHRYIGEPIETRSAARAHSRLPSSLYLLPSSFLHGPSRDQKTRRHDASSATESFPSSNSLSSGARERYFFLIYLSSNAESPEPAPDRLGNLNP